MPKPKRLRKVAVTIYLEPEDVRALRDLSKRTHVPQQFYLREGLSLALERHFPIPAP